DHRCLRPQDPQEARGGDRRAMHRDGMGARLLDEGPVGGPGDVPMSAAGEGNVDLARLGASLAPGTVLVVGTGAGYEQKLLDGRHVLTADEPASVGGRDAGPNPYELLLMALGACTSMPLEMYAR